MTSEKSNSKRVFAVMGLLGLAAVAFGGCAETRQEIKQALGLEKQEVDETEVITGPPLTLPPDYDLRPPQYGDAEAYAPNAPLPQPQADPYAQQGYRAELPQGYGQQPYAQQPYAQPGYAAAPQQPQGQPQGQPQYYDPNLAAIQNSMAYANQAYQATNQYGAYQQPYYGQQPYAAQPYYGQQPQAYGQQPYAQPYYGQAPQPYAQQPYYGQQPYAPPAQQPYYGQAAQPPAPPARTLSTSEANPAECEKIVTDASGNYVCEE